MLLNFIAHDYVLGIMRYKLNLNFKKLQTKNNLKCANKWYIFET